MFKRVLSAIAGLLLVTAIAFASEPWENLEEKQSYCLPNVCDETNYYVCQDFMFDKEIGLGLMKVYSWTAEGYGTYHMLMLDTDKDGQCDMLGLVKETGWGTRHWDKSGTNYPLVSSMGTAPCETWDAMVDDVESTLKDLEKGDGV